MHPTLRPESRKQMDDISLVHSPLSAQTAAGCAGVLAEGCSFRIHLAKRLLGAFHLVECERLRNRR
jgi:hypothetical protein